jgi:hypothetical protein
MKRLAIVAAVLAIAACKTENKTQVTDTSAPAMNPAPADTGMGGMKMDTGMKADTGMKRDTSMKRDTTRTKSGARTKRP